MVKQQAVDVRAALERSGLDHGPISVHDKMRAMGLPAPSVASLARIFRDKGVARLEPKKKPRSAYRRFVYPAPNACWQLDGTAYVLAGGRTCVILQLQDDHSRVAVATHVATSESAAAALAVFIKGIKARGVPQRLLTDNGLALNPSRRGYQGHLVTYAARLGVEAITGKPGKPTTQGKNERLHRTLFQWLNKQPLAESIEQLQQRVDEFDVLYNTQRPHQSLPGRITPEAAWAATPVADPPRPSPRPAEAVPPTSNNDARQRAVQGLHPDPSPAVGHDSHDHKVLQGPANGSVQIRRIKFQISAGMAGQHIHVAWDLDGIVFADQHGEVIIEHPWPPEGTTYVSNGRPRGRPRTKPQTSPKS